MRAIINVNHVRAQGGWSKEGASVWGIVTLGVILIHPALMSSSLFRFRVVFKRDSVRRDAQSTVATHIKVFVHLYTFNYARVPPSRHSRGGHASGN